MLYKSVTIGYYIYSVINELNSWHLTPRLVLRLGRLSPRAKPSTATVHLSRAANSLPLSSTTVSLHFPSLPFLSPPFLSPPFPSLPFLSPPFLSPPFPSLTFKVSEILIITSHKPITTYHSPEDVKLIRSPDNQATAWASGVARWFSKEFANNCNVLIVDYIEDGSRRIVKYIIINYNILMLYTPVTIYILSLIN